MRLFISCLIIYGLHLGAWLYAVAFAIVFCQWAWPRLDQMRRESNHLIAERTKSDARIECARQAQT